jgi:hypothetical protein
MLVPPARCAASLSCGCTRPVVRSLCAGAQEAADARTPVPAAPLGLAAGGAETAFADLARVLISTLRAIGLFLVVPQMPFRPSGAMIRRARVLVLAVWGAGAVIEGASIGGLTVLPALAAHPVFPFRIRAVVAPP